MKPKLDHAYRERVLVRLFRNGFDGDSALGYVVGVGPEFFLLGVVADDLNFDGFQALRIGDVSHLESPHEYAAFVERALALRDAQPPKSPGVDLSSAGSIIRSAARAFSLVTIHLEETDPDVCWIGSPLSVGDTTVSLREISPAATWIETPAEYSLAEITRIDFGGRYEEALWLVGRE